MNIRWAEPHAMNCRPNKPLLANFYIPQLISDNIEAPWLFSIYTKAIQPLTIRQYLYHVHDVYAFIHAFGAYAKVWKYFVLTYLITNEIGPA